MNLESKLQVSMSKRAGDVVLRRELAQLESEPSAVDGADSRAAARLQQACIEQSRLMRHQRIALDLATFPHDAASQLIEQARQVVKRWKHEHLCSKDYIERWESILNLPPKEMSETIVSDMDGWGSALRQNSPWVGLYA